MLIKPDLFQMLFQKSFLTKQGLERNQSRSQIPVGALGKPAPVPGACRQARRKQQGSRMPASARGGKPESWVPE